MRLQNSTKIEINTTSIKKPIGITLFQNNKYSNFVYHILMQCQSLYFCFYLLHFCIFSTYAQQESEKKYKYDTAYIKDLSDRLSIRIYGVINSVLRYKGQ